MVRGSVDGWPRGLLRNAVAFSFAPAANLRVSQTHGRLIALERQRQPRDRVSLAKPRACISCTRICIIDWRRGAPTCAKARQFAPNRKAIRNGFFLAFVGLFAMQP